MDTSDHPSLHLAHDTIRAVRAWRDDVLNGRVHPQAGLTHVTRMSSAVLDALELMAETAFAMADDVDYAVWDGLAHALDRAAVRMDSTHLFLETRSQDADSPAACHPAVDAVVGWTQAIIDDLAGFTPSNTLHLSVIVVDIAHALQVRLAGADLDSEVRGWATVALTLSNAARIPVVAEDDQSTLPDDVATSDVHCDHEQCWRTDMITRVIIWSVAPTADAPFRGMWQNRCPHHRR